MAGRDRIVSNMSATDLPDAVRRQSEQFEEDKTPEQGANDDDFDFVETKADRRASNKFGLEAEDSDLDGAAKAVKTGGGKKKKKQRKLDKLEKQQQDLQEKIIQKKTSLADSMKSQFDQFFLEKP